MKREFLCSKVVGLLLACLFCLQTAWAAESWNYPTKETKPDGKFGGGSGTAESPYLIKTAQQLADLAWKVNDGTKYKGTYFELTNDIVLNDIEFGSDNKPTNLNSLKEWKSIGDYGAWSNDYFCGIFDGKNHTISGMVHNLNHDVFHGMFGALDGAIVRNLNIKDSYMYGNARGSSAGMFAGYMVETQFSNCHVTGSHIDVTFTDDDKSGYCNVSGFIGQGSGKGKSLTACSFDGSICLDYKQNTTCYVAGLMALGAPDLTDCKVSGNMEIYSSDNKSGYVYANGLCKEAKDIKNCRCDINIKVGTKGESHELSSLDLYSLCETAENISQTAYLGTITVENTDGWNGTLNNVGVANSVADCAFYGSVRNTIPESAKKNGHLVYRPFGKEKGSISSMPHNVFLDELHHTFNSPSTDQLSMTTFFIDDPSTFYVTSIENLLEYKVCETFNVGPSNTWGKIKDDNLFGGKLNGCPLPVACGGNLDGNFKGEGTEESPYLIGSEAELRQLAQGVSDGSILSKGKYYALTTNLDMTNSEPIISIGSSTEHPFYGSFDGQGHIITGLKINGSGLFGIMQKSTLKRLGVVGAEVIVPNSPGEIYVEGGVLVGHLFNSKVKSCYVGGDITYTPTGEALALKDFAIASICGRLSVGDNEITNCYFKGRYIINHAYNKAAVQASGIATYPGGVTSNCYASFSVVDSLGINHSIYGIGYGKSIKEDCYYVCDQVTSREYGTQCDDDSQIFAHLSTSEDSPWLMGAYRPVLKDMRNYVVTAPDGTDTKTYYDAIPLMDSKHLSNKIYHYAAVEGDENDKLLWALPNLAIYNSADKSDYILNCTLQPKKPLGYTPKTGRVPEAVKVNMHYPLKTYAQFPYSALCLPGTVQLGDLPEGSKLYIGGKVFNPEEGYPYMNVVETDSVPGGVPFVLYVPTEEETLHVDVVMRSRMALQPLKQITIDGETHEFDLKGTFVGEKDVDNANTLVESFMGKISISQPSYGPTDIPPFNSYLVNSKSLVYLRDYLMLDETSNEISKLLEENAGKERKVYFYRSLNDSEWHTICLPFNLSADEVAKVFGENTKLEELSSAEPTIDGGCALKYVKATDGIKAGRNYLIFNSKDFYHCMLYNRIINTELHDEEKLVNIDGTLVSVKVCGTFSRLMLGNADEEQFYVDKGRTCRVPHGASILQDGFRSYFTASKPITELNLVHSDGTVTVVSQIKGDNQGCDAQHIYDLNGIEHQAGQLPHGVYVKGGHKYVHYK